MTLFHFSNYCTLHKNNFVYINYCYTDKIYYLPFRKRLSNYFVAVVIKHTGHLEMNFGFTLTKRQRFICISDFQNLMLLNLFAILAFEKKQSWTFFLWRLMLHPKDIYPSVTGDICSLCFYIK